MHTECSASKVAGPIGSGRRGGWWMGRRGVGGRGGGEYTVKIRTAGVGGRDELPMLRLAPPLLRERVLY